MKNQEFKTQIFKTPEQWESGLLYRLELLESGGISLYPTPTFIHWMQGIDETINPTGLAIDECGQVYFIDAKTCQLCRYDSKTQWVEKMCIGGCGSDPGKFKSPTRIIIGKLTLWVIDTGNQRIQAFSRENYQIKYIIDSYIDNQIQKKLEEPVDIAVSHEEGNLYILDRTLKQVLKYDNNGHFLDRFDQLGLNKPVGLALSKKNKLLYIIDEGYKCFLTFTEQWESSREIGNFTDLPIEENGQQTFDLQPSTIAIDQKGNIFIGDETAGVIHQFDPDGSYVGTIRIPDFTGPIRGLATDSKGNLYASTHEGIALLSIEQRFTKKPGVYYSKTLDSGIRNCQWHRLALQKDLPPKTVLEAYFYADDSFQLKEDIDENLSDAGKSTQEKADFIDQKIPESLWIGPEKNPADMLFRGKTGRYLWLKLILSTFDEKVRPTVKQMKVLYPRISYLRYLPAIYQEDPASREFLERFLSLFESTFYDREVEISQLFKYFDPESTSPGFLPWLAAWLNMALEEEWPEEKKRQFIQQASTLYKLKGTPNGIRTFIEIYTGKQAVILEHARVGKPMILRENFHEENFRLGIDSLLIRTPVRGFRLGDDSILGRVALRDTVQSPEDPFLQMAHRFTIILDFSTAEWTRYQKGLKRILDEEKPAHTVYNLRFVNEMRVGMGTYVGINTRVADHRPMQLGVDSILGTGLIVFDNGEISGKVEKRSKVATDTLFI